MSTSEQSLETFVAAALAAGKSQDEIRAVLLDNDWSDEEISRAMRGWAGSAFGLAVPRPTPQTTARDWFLYATHFAALLASAWAITAIGFDLAGMMLPDIAFSRHYDAEGVRLPLAILIVAYPAYVWICRLLAQDTNPTAKRPASPVRRWAVNGLLFIAAIVMLIDLIALLYGFLEGNLSWPFLGKVGLVAVTFGLIFARYYSAGADDGNRSQTAPHLTLLQSHWPLHVLAIAVFIGGIVVMQTPASARDERLDQVRSQHLQSLSNAVSCYAHQQQALPETLPALADTPDCGVSDLRDPITGALYAYRAIDDTRFELCAVFDSDTTDQMHITIAPNYYRHMAGPTCFTDHIEPAEPHRPKLKTGPVR